MAPQLPAPHQTLKALRGWRVSPGPEWSIAPLLRQLVQRLTRGADALTRANQAWNAVVPEPLRTRCRPERLVGGMLTVRVPDAATRFELDRFLRAGGTAALIAASHRCILRVRLR